MECAACHHENDTDDRFCGHCGSALLRRCARCEAELKPGKKFCTSCGAAVEASDSAASTDARAGTNRDYTPKHLADKILKTRSAIEGERKRVTVLFADIEGSMALADQLDPEHWHHVLDEFFSILTAVVHRYEGTVNQYTGDGIMALFGAPIAHEDHAQRACYAALDAREKLKGYADSLRMELGLNFGIRIGINSGDVVVGKIGDDLRMDYTAQGHTVGLAQRIEQLAATNCVYLSEHCASLIAGYFELRDLGATQLRGTESRVGIFELLGTGTSRTRLDVSRSRGLTPFVGRADEMSHLHAALSRARDGHGQVVGVVGKPGLGKSRLCFEFIERCRADGLPIYEAHCPAHGKNIPHLPILELLRNYFEIVSSDTPAQARKKIPGTLALLDPALQETLPVLFEFMAIADPNQPVPRVDADARQRQLTTVLHQLHRAHAEQDLPGLIMIDDLHWVDPGSDLFIAQFVAATEGSRSLLLLNFRPEYEAAWMRSGHYQQLPLVPLGPNDLRELVRSLLGNDASVTSLVDRIVHWTGGNPFYTEEVIQSLTEVGDLEGQRGAFRLVGDVDKLAAPANVRSVLAARIDRLADGAKQLLQTASVIGKEFTASLLASIDELNDGERAQAVEQLKSGDFIFERAIYPIIEYSFKHPLTQEVAYNTLLKQRRAALHKAVAEAVATAEPDKLDERAALLAYHWEQAEQPVATAAWHQKAAQWAGNRDPSAAARHWRRARELLSDQPANPHSDAARALACASLLHLSIRTGLSEEDATIFFNEGNELGTRLHDHQLLSLLNGGYGMYNGVCRGHAEVYRTHGIECARLADLTANHELQYIARIFHQYGALFSGRFRECVEVGEAMIALHGDDAGFAAELIPQNPLITFHLAQVLAWLSLGDVARAQTSAAEIARLTPDSTWVEGYALDESMQAKLAGWRGQIAAHSQRAERALEIAEESGSYFIQVFARLELGGAHLAADQASAALDCLAVANELNETTGAAWVFHGAIEGQRSRALLDLGRLDEATVIARTAVEFCVPKRLFHNLQPWLSLARAEILGGDRVNARATLHAAQQLIDETEGRWAQPFIHELRAQYAGDWDAARELDAARQIYVQLDMTGHAERLASQSGS